MRSGGSCCSPFTTALAAAFFVHSKVSAALGSVTLTHFFRFGVEKRENRVTRLGRMDDFWSENLIKKKESEWYVE